MSPLPAYPNRYRVNQDQTSVLAGFLDGSPQDFNRPNDLLKGRNINWGTNKSYYVSSEGMPDGPTRDRFNADMDAGKITYVVMSYGVPIAWRTRVHAMFYEWAIPDIRYSNTTSKHQAKVKAALALITSAVDPKDE